MLSAARDGKLAVLSIFGANPALHHPDGPGVADALDRTPFVVVSDLFMTQSARRANLVLPAKGSYEKSGTTVNAVGDLLPIEVGLQAPDGALSDLEMLIGLGQQLGITLPSTEEVDAAVVARVAGARPHVASEDARSLPTVGEGLQLAFETRSFAGGGTSANDARIATLRPLPQASVAPATAASLGVETGDYIDLRSGEVTMHDVLVEVRQGIAPGTIVLIDGLPDDPANLFGGARAGVENVRKPEPAAMPAGV